jgi:HEAT repeat protein
MAQPDEKDIESKRSNERFNGKTLFEWSNDLKEKDVGVQEQAIAAMKYYGRAARREMPILLKAMAHHDVSLRVNAIITVGFIGFNPDQIDQGVDALRRCLSDSQGIVRFQAARTLDRIGQDARAATPALIALTRDSASWEIRQAACAALGNVGWEPPEKPGFNRPAWIALIRALNDSCSEVRLAAVLSLILYGRPTSPADIKGEEQALQFLTSEKHPRTNEKQSKKVIIWAHVGLMRITEVSDHHLSGITKYCKNADMTARVHAIRAMAVIGPSAKAKVPDLIECLSDKEAQVLYWACVALGNMGDAAKQAMPELEKLKQHQDPMVADAAVQAIDKVSLKRRVDDGPEKKKKKG